MHLRAELRNAVVQIYGVSVLEEFRADHTGV